MTSPVAFLFDLDGTLVDSVYITSAPGISRFARSGYDDPADMLLHLRTRV